MKTITTFFVTAGTSSPGNKADKIIQIGERLKEEKIDIIFSSPDSESLEFAREINGARKEDIPIYISRSLSYSEKATDAMLKRQIDKIIRSLEKEHARKIILIISHKEINYRFIARYVGSIGQYCCLQRFID